MAELVRKSAQVAENIYRLHGYGRGTDAEKKFHRQTIKNGKLFVHLREKGKSFFAPSKFAGYFSNNLNVSRTKGRDGRDTNPHLDVLLGGHLDKGDPGYVDVDQLFVGYCNEFGITPSVHHKDRRYWTLNLSNDLNQGTDAKVGGKKNVNLWSDAELESSVETYFQMLHLEIAKKPYNKAQFIKALLADPLRGRKSADHRMQNISFILQKLKCPWIGGFKPLPNVGTASGERLREIIKRHLDTTEILKPVMKPIARTGRKLPPTGYWIFVCNRSRWDGAAWLRAEREETLYMVSGHHHDEVQVGDLGVLRLNKRSVTAARSGEPAGVYALFEVTEVPVMRPSEDEFAFSDPKDGVAPKWRARVRLLENLVDKPVDAFLLPKGPDFNHLREPLPNSTIPLAECAFHEIVKRAGISPRELQYKRDTLTRAGIRRLERAAAHLDPIKKEKLSSEIERGPVGAQVKAFRKYRCQICEALGQKSVAFLKKGGAGYAEAHHVYPVSLMLAGSLADVNIMVLCPNHHRQAHYGNFEVKEYRKHDWLVEVDGTSVEVPRTQLP
jgi:hypothetical protein